MTARFTDHELVTLTEKVAGSVDLYLRIATDAERTQGLNWYVELNRKCSVWGKQFKVAPKVVADIVAILSPQQQLARNIECTIEVLQGRHPNYFRKFSSRAIAARYGEPYVVSGPKVRSFADNIADPHRSNAVTLDTWICRSLGVPPKRLERKGVYEAIAEGFRIAASKHGIRPLQAQAIVWVVVRGSHD